MHSSPWTTDYTASRTIAASATAITEVLLDAPQLPLWNPALSSVSPPRMNGSHSIVALRVLHGRLRYVDNPIGITMLITIPGLRELSHWFIQSRGNKTSPTLIEHRVRQQGPLASLIGAHEAEKVPLKRLDRLAGIIHQH